MHNIISHLVYNSTVRVQQRTDDVIEINLKLISPESTIGISSSGGTDSRGNVSLIFSSLFSFLLVYLLTSEGGLQRSVDQLGGKRIELWLIEGEGGKLIHGARVGSVHASNLVVFACKLGADLVGCAQQIITWRRRRMKVNYILKFQ